MISSISLLLSGSNLLYSCPIKSWVQNHMSSLVMSQNPSSGSEQYISSYFFVKISVVNLNIALLFKLKKVMLLHREINRFGYHFLLTCK